LLKYFPKKKRKELSVQCVEYWGNSILEKIVLIMRYVVSAHQFIIAPGHQLIHSKNTIPIP
jgi:hypothetical protein